jgi:holo-[acyl-carrier protein] synthase
MISGLGNDLIEVERVRRALSHPRTGRRFRERVFTEREQLYCERRGKKKYESYAARFAAKEAVMKALGTGWGSRAAWRDIEVFREPGARPTIILHGSAKKTAKSLGISAFHLALTHTRSFALAEVAAEKS